MRDLCLDEGTLQSYYDGQLEPKALEQVSSHLASCSFCAEAVRQVESEMALATDAFAAEMDLSVPSKRLRSRLDEAIAGLSAPHLLHEDRTTSRLRAWLASVASTFNLSPQRAIGFASLLVFFVLAAVVGGIVLRQRVSQTSLELVEDNQKVLSAWSFAGPIDVTEGTVKDHVTKLRLTRSSVRPRATGSGIDDQPLAAHRMLPGEKNYLQAISLLTEAIEVNGETSLKPTLLADYKRTLEVVNQAITATQRTARTNPKSPDAAEMLFAVYQSKLDLLSAVAEQSRPMIAQR
jgi:hypothetical protein